MAFAFINYMCTLKVINWYGMVPMLLKIEAYSHRPSLLRDLRGCESEVHMAKDEDNDVATLDNDVLFRLACAQSSL